MKIISLFVAVIAFALVATNANAQRPTYPRGDNARTGAIVPPVDEDDDPDDQETPIGNIKSVVEALRDLNRVVEEQNGRLETIEKALANQTCPESKDGDILTSLSLLSQTQADATKTLAQKIESALNDDKLAEKIDAIKTALASTVSLDKIDALKDELKADVANIATTQTQTTTELKSALDATESNVKDAVAATPQPEKERPFGSFWNGLKTSASTTIIGFVIWQSILGCVRIVKKSQSKRKEKEDAMRQELQRLQALRSSPQPTTFQQVPTNLIDRSNQDETFKLF